MILLHIIPKKEEHTNEIVELLVEKKLILNAIIQRGLTQRQPVGKGGRFMDIPASVIMGKTKALLFNTVDNVLRERYGEDRPVLYSLPIVHMDWYQAKELQQETEKV